MERLDKLWHVDFRDLQTINKKVRLAGLSRVTLYFSQILMRVSDPLQVQPQDLLRQELQWKAGLRQLDLCFTIIW